MGGLPGAMGGDGTRHTGPLLRRVQGGAEVQVQLLGLRRRRRRDNEKEERQ